MQEPFDIEINGMIYSVFPEEDGIYTIFKEGVEYLKIQKDAENHWLKLDEITEIPLFDADPEVDLLGKEILLYQEE
ncbi:hypothetical protein [Daejeonella oryzae]|uniref:hypothetical protein n=1 Tax=Daejeonella oryzae TaxID=1122943 RepID=UPI000409B84C|nr:hypothetical protein [Daejeonella oryzae]